MKYESKFCSVLLKKHLNKKLIITKEDDKDFENSTKVLICDHVYVDSDVKLLLMAFNF